MLDIYRRIDVNYNKGSEVEMLPWESWVMIKKIITFVNKQFNHGKTKIKNIRNLEHECWFLGIQFGFALQNSNASRILQSFGADVHQLSWFWIVAPLTGMIIQPIIGHYSDHTWNRLGRRKPYFWLVLWLPALVWFSCPMQAYLQQYYQLCG